MKYPVVSFLSFWTAGILSLAGGRVLTRARWRGDIPPFRKQIGIIQLALYPERFAAPKALPLIHFLNGAGVVLMSAGLSVFIHAMIFR